MTQGTVDQDQPEAGDERAAESRTERVRIIGAHRAAEGEAARPEPAAPFGPDDWPSVEPELPHWTDAPTGEVPAVLARDDEGADPWSTPVPTWREGETDWQHDETFDAAALAASEDEPLAPLTSLDRQPWAFELDGGDSLDENNEALFSDQRLDEDPLVDDVGFGANPALFHAGEPTEVLELPPERTASPAAEPSRAAPTRAEREDEALAADLEAHAGRLPWRGTRRLARAGRVLAAEAAEEVPVQTGPASSAPGSLSISSRITARPKPSAPARRGRGAPAPGPVSNRTGRNMPLAVTSGVAIGVVALVAFHFGTVPAMVVVTAVVALAAMEAFAAFRRAGYHPATLLGLVATVAVLIATYAKGSRAVPAVIVLLVALTFVWHLAGVDRRADPVRSSAATLLVFCWVGIFGSYAALLLAPSEFPNRHGIAYLLGAIIAAVAYDVGALAIGAWVGRHPLSAASPNKTWEGLIGGTVAALVFSVAIVHFIHPWTMGKAAALGLVVAVASPLGDLAESLVKRALGLKDMGRILPGHGGLLDRVDGLLFVLPATFYLVKAFHLS